MKLKLVKIELSSSSNPTNWTTEYLDTLVDNKVIVGYLLRTYKGTPMLNLYVITKEYLESESYDKILSLTDIRNAFLQWLDSLEEDLDSFMFRNPPIKEWLDTKENWVKGAARKLSNTYNKPVDECISTVYYVIMVCYNNPKVYIGSLNYINLAAHNSIRTEFERDKNRWHGGNPAAISLDQSCVDSEGQDNNLTYHEIIGKADPFYALEDFNELKELVMDDMRTEFSEREIDQILNYPEFLSNSLYRKWLKWRKPRKLGDYK